MAVPDPRPGALRDAGAGPETGAGGAIDSREPVTFDALRALGVELTQALSADRWTDYNVHDPGVTILEQACYALADLAYRADLDVADLLTGEDGRIDFRGLALRAPEQILPCRPTTLEDYRRAILDRVAEAENVWFEPVRPGDGENSIAGLYRIEVRPRPAYAQSDVCKAVRAAYRSLRNLCEDVESVRLAAETECSLLADIEVHRRRDPAEILAEIYARCATYLAGDVQVRPFEEARRGGRPLEDILEGPLGTRGFWDVRGAAHERPGPVGPALSELVRSIEGVDLVHSLQLRADGDAVGRAAPSDARGVALRLRVPRTSAEIQVLLRTEDRAVPVEYASFTARFEQWTFRGLSAAGPQDPAKLRELPRGERRDLGVYTSIQNELPAVYGISERGMPGSAPTYARARALQLRGYLLLFDQLMANFAAGLAALPDLFSSSLTTGRTYSSQPVDPTRTPDLDRIYDGTPGEVLASILEGFDAFDDRKGRVLDYLLALYGEEFTQRSLRTFDVYTNPSDRQRAILENKQAFLESVDELGRDRGAGVSPGADSSPAQSGLERRVALLLGFGARDWRILTGPLVDEHARTDTPDMPGERYAALDGLRVVAREEIRTPARPDGGSVAPERDVPPGEEDEPDELGQRFGDLLLLPEHPIGARLFAGGVSLDRYRLGHLGTDDAWHLFFDLEEDGRWCALGTFDDPADAARAANRLRRRLVALNRACEGLYVIEHALLRSMQAGARPRPPAAWYSFRISVVFPGWTARCAQDGFRKLARETVVACCPAHVAPSILWLSPLQMRRFERLHARWLDLWSRDAAAPGELDAASGALVALLEQAVA